MKNLYLLSIVIFVAACGSNSNPNLLNAENRPSTDQGGNTEDDSALQDVVNAIKACFSGNCFSLVNKANITTPNEYKYKDPTGSFSTTLAKQYRAPSRFIDLLNSSNPTSVSANFKAGEYLSASKGRYGVLSPLLVSNIQKIREKLGKSVRITSGFRGPAYNAQVDGSATWSRHQYGDGVDFQVSGMSPSSLKKYCTDLGASYTQLYVSHIHCDWRLKPLPEEFYPTNAVQKAELAQNAVSLQRELHSQFSQNIELYIEGEVKLGETLGLYIDANNKEDEDDLYVEWKVFFNNEEVSATDDIVLELPLAKKGFYRIEALVGGNWKKTYTFTVE